jgi:hypothetical protein
VYWEIVHSSPNIILYYATLHSRLSVLVPFNHVLILLCVEEIMNIYATLLTLCLYHRQAFLCYLAHSIWYSQQWNNVVSDKSLTYLVYFLKQLKMPYIFSTGRMTQVVCVCLASMRPWVQPSVQPKWRKKRKVLFHHS